MISEDKQTLAKIGKMVLAGFALTLGLIALAYLLT